MRNLLGLVLLGVACSSGAAGLIDGDGGSGGTDGAGATTVGGSDGVPGPVTSTGAGGEAGLTAAGGEGGASTGDGGQPTLSDAGQGGGGAPLGGEGGDDAGGTDGGSGGAAPCTKATFYADTDGDGFGNPKVTVKACQAPAGYVADGTDCYDDSANAKPGQTNWFTTDRGDGSFDYDCDNSEELRYPEFFPCPELDNACPPPNHWPDGFSCDYSGMVAPYSQAEATWRQYEYAVCGPSSCVNAPVDVPACGESGRYGKPPLSWDSGSDEYVCEQQPYLSAEQTAKLPTRKQSCR